MFACRRLFAKTGAGLAVPEGWGVVSAGGKEFIERTYTFKDFHGAWGFMASSVDFINTKDHHPEWFNVYNRVNIKLTTHDAGNTVTAKDIDLATHFNEKAASQPK